MELLRVAHDPIRRQAIFIDISKTPSLIHEIWQELLLHLGRANYKLVTRGGSRPLIASSVPQTTAQPDPRAIPIKQADIFRPVAQKPLTFGLSLLDGPVRAKPPQPVIKATEKTLRAVNEIKQVQGQVLERIESTPTGHTVLIEATGRLDIIYGWAAEEWARSSVERSLPDQDLVRHIIDSSCRSCRHPVMRS